MPAPGAARLALDEGGFDTMPPLLAIIRFLLQADRQSASRAVPPRWSLLMSTQLIAQPFVWRQYPVDEVLSAWFDLLVQRLVVAVSIASVVTLSFRIATPRPWLRAALLLVAIVAGALLGEGLLVAAGALQAPPDRLSSWLRLVQWCTLATGVSSLLYLWQRALDTESARRATELRRLQLEQQLAQARLQALRQQIEPHFLFNTLATVRRLHDAGEPGTRLLAQFVAYLRSTLPAADVGEASAGIAGPADTLGRELELVRAYLGIVEVRMAGRLQVRFEIEDGLQRCAFPPLTLATLVENAIKHGIAPAPAGGSVTVHARRSAPAQLEAGVADTGAGFSGSGGSGLGLANTRARLRALYGERGALALAVNQPRGVRATIRVPLVRLPAGAGA